MLYVGDENWEPTVPEFCSFGTIYILLSISDCETIHPLPFLSSNNYSTRQCARVHAGQDKQIQKCGRSCQFWGLGMVASLINYNTYWIFCSLPSSLVSTLIRHSTQFVPSWKLFILLWPLHFVCSQLLLCFLAKLITTIPYSM